MPHLRFYFYGVFTLLLLTSCKSKKPVVASNSIKSKTEVAEKSSSKVVSTEEKHEIKKPEEALKKISDKTLVNFIEEWYGVTYKYGGADKHGIDCSHFTAKLYADVYNKQISGAASSLEPLTSTLNMTDIQDGDLVFFKIDGNKVSHVGVYIGNNKFVHASTKRGVIISDLNEPYYKKYFFKAGRLK